MIPVPGSTGVRIVPIALYTIVAINIAVFVHEVSFASSAASEHFIDAYALIPYDLTHGVEPEGFPVPAVATLVTSQFLHGSVLHIFFNLLFLVVFGPQIEALLGHVRFVAFYLACGIAGGLAQTAMAPASHVPGIGASGAIAGVLGAFVLRYPLRGIETIVPIGCFPLFVRLPAIALIGVWAATQFVHGFDPVTTRVLSEEGGGTAYFAHIGGFVAGVLLLAAFGPRGARSPGARSYRRYVR